MSEENENPCVHSVGENLQSFAVLQNNLLGERDRRVTQRLTENKDGVKRDMTIYIRL